MGLSSGEASAMGRGAQASSFLVTAVLGSSRVTWESGAGCWVFRNQLSPSVSDQQKQVQLSHL